MAHAEGTTLKQLVKLPKNPEACWEWLGAINNKGVPMKQHNGRPVAARRWMWAMLFGDPPPGLEVYGKCGTQTCVNPHHIACGTTAARIHAGPLASLTPGDVKEIKKAKHAGVYEKAAIAMKYGVTANTLRDIWRGDTWSSVK